MAQTETREPGVHTVAVTVNGKRYSREVEPRQLLVYFIREQLGLTGTHVGCDTSQCGACTVEIDGRAVKSCTTLVGQGSPDATPSVNGSRSPRSAPVGSVPPRRPRARHAP